MSDADHRNVQPPAEDDVYGVSTPVETNIQHELAAEYMRKAERVPVSVSAPPPPRPRWIMLSGVFSFPFYPKSVGIWVLITVGLVVTSYLFMFLVTYGIQLGLMGVWLFGLPVCAFGLLTVSYTAACSLVVIEETFNGWDAIENWPETNFKEWIWSFAHVAALVLEAGIVGGLVPHLLLANFTPWPLVIGTLVALPFVLLGALAGDGAWFPTAIGRVLRSLLPICWAWGVFYVITGLLIAGWLALTAAALAAAPVASPLVAAPVLAAVVMIYARLLGRLARLIGEQEEG